jgi:hypothetical protein
MSNALYDAGRDGFLTGAIDWDTNTFRFNFIDEADDTIDLAVDDNLDDRAGAAIVATSGDMTTSAPGAGIADANDQTITAVTGDQFESLDIYKQTGTASTSRLVCNIDTATGLPMTPNGGDISVTWDNGTNKIFKL